MPTLKSLIQSFLYLISNMNVQGGQALKSKISLKAVKLFQRIKAEALCVWLTSRFLVKYTGQNVSVDGFLC